MRKKEKIISFAAIFVLSFSVISGIRSIGGSANKDVSSGTGNPFVNNIDAKNDSLLEQAKYYISKKDYEDALDVLNQIDQGYSKYANVLELKDKCTDELVKTVVTEALEYKKEGKLDNAITMLRSSKFSDYPDIKIACREYEKQYLDDVIAAAERVCEASGAEESIALINDAISILPDSNELISLRDKYEDRRPVNLMVSGKTIIGDVSTWSYLQEPCKDNTSSEHTRSWRLPASSFAVAESITFMLDGEYTSLSSNLFLGVESKSTKMWGYLEFSDQDGRIIGKSPTIEAGSRVEEYTIDVTGVRDLTITPYYSHALGWSVMYMYTDGIYVSK